MRTYRTTLVITIPDAACTDTGNGALERLRASLNRMLRADWADDDSGAEVHITELVELPASDRLHQTLYTS